jgi:hypothetical protein
MISSAPASLVNLLVEGAEGSPTSVSIRMLTATELDECI